MVAHVEQVSEVAAPKAGHQPSRWQRQALVGGICDGGLPGSADPSSTARSGRGPQIHKSCALRLHRRRPSREDRSGRHSGATPQPFSIAITLCCAITKASTRLVAELEQHDVLDGAVGQRPPGRAPGRSHGRPSAIRLSGRTTCFPAKSTLARTTVPTAGVSAVARPDETRVATAPPGRAGTGAGPRSWFARYASRRVPTRFPLLWPGTRNRQRQAPSAPRLRTVRLHSHARLWYGRRRRRCSSAGHHKGVDVAVPLRGGKWSWPTVTVLSVALLFGPEPSRAEGDPWLHLSIAPAATTALRPAPGAGLAPAGLHLPTQAPETPENDPDMSFLTAQSMACLITGGAATVAAVGLRVAERHQPDLRRRRAGGRPRSRGPRAVRRGVHLLLRHRPGADAALPRPDERGAASGAACRPAAIREARSRADDQPVRHSDGQPAPPVPIPVASTSCNAGLGPLRSWTDPC